MDSKYFKYYFGYFGYFKLLYEHHGFIFCREFKYLQHLLTNYILTIYKYIVWTTNSKCKNTEFSIFFKSEIISIQSDFDSSFNHQYLLKYTNNHLKDI